MNKQENKPEIEYQSNGQPVAYGFEDLLGKLGYKKFQPHVGSVGHALIKASKNQGRSSFLNKMLDSYFQKLRKQRKKDERKKQNSRNTLQPNVQNNSQKCG